jgi:hypothetical protein
MTSASGLRELTDADVQAELERVLAPRLISLLATRQPGHCARVTDAEASLAARLCEQIRAGVDAGAQAFVLGEPPLVPAELAVTSTKLVELRNPDAIGQLRAPLLVFVPPGSRASAEDSFGVATFEEISLGDVYADLATRLLAELPSELRRGVTEVLDLLDEEKWPHAGSYARARFLLTIALNNNDPSVVGATFFELGLVPDLDLFTDPSLIRTRTGQNVRAMRVLDHADRPERQRVLELGLTEPAFRARLATFVAASGLDDPYSWTRRIVMDRANWNLSFHRWPLREERTAQALALIVRDVGLPRAGDRPEHANNAVLRNLSGLPYLVAGQQGPNQFPVPFDVEPDPRGVPGLARFTAQLISEDAGPTGVTAAVKVSATGRSGYRVNLTKLRAAGLDQGWHFVRVLPTDDEGIPLPVESSSQDPHPDNESERFFVIAVGEEDDDLDDVHPAERAETQPGVTQALRALQFRTLEQGRDWRTVHCLSAGWKGEGSTGQHVLRAAFGSRGNADIPLSPVLTSIERQILADPARPARWDLAVDGEQAAAAVRVEIDWPTAADGPVRSYLAARKIALGLIRGADDLVTEGRDLLELRQVTVAYAESFGEMLSWQLAHAERSDDTQRPALLRDLAAMLQADTVETTYTDSDGAKRPVVLTAPTYPLRLLWLTAWAELGRHWLEKAADASPSAVAATEHTLSAMSPLGFPLVVPRGGGQLAIAAADLTPYWGICLPTDTQDPQELLAGVSRALRLPSSRSSGPITAAPVLVDRVERYLRQHPYASTLVISAVNPGRGDQLADMLVELQRRKDLKHVSYDIRVFSADNSAAGTGAALRDLLRGEWSTSAHAEVFHIRQASGLIPKLAVAVLPLSEFRASTDERPSHLTFLFDAFSGETFDAAPGGASPDTLPVHGLVQDVVVHYIERDDEVMWHKQPRHGTVIPIPDAEEAGDLLASLPATISAAAAAVATGQPGAGLIPRITLSLTPADGALLHQAHRSSDWVVTIDRTLGMEYFDSPASERRPDYVIDFEAGTEPGLGGLAGLGLGHHVVVSSRSLDELRALMAPVIAQHGLPVDPRHVGTFFDQLRLLSGRLAFKLASTTASQRTEVLGLALARLYLDYQGVLTDQVLLPLDDHLELYREARRRATDANEAVSLQRTDLALWSLDAQRRVITCRLVEVKCYSAVRGDSGYEHLRDRVAAQLSRSETVLAERFDPASEVADRPDRAVRNAELASLLRFYLGRAVRHGMIRDDAASEAGWLLSHLDDNTYRMAFTRTGLVFDLSGTGTSSDSVGGVEYHRIGQDLIVELLEAIPTDAVLAAHRTGPTLDGLRVSLPRLDDVAFRAPERDHSTPQVQTRIEPGSDADLNATDGDTATDSDDGSPDDSDMPDPVVPRTPDLVIPETESAATLAGSQEAPANASPDSRPTMIPDVFLGTDRPSPQYGIIGEDSALGRTIALDLNETHTISLFGVQGGGKSYTLGSIIEAATVPAPPVTQLPSPLATIVFHYSPTLDYAPEFTSMISPNGSPEQIERLRERYQVAPDSLDDILLLVPADQLDQRQAEHPDIQVLPLKFGSRELRAEHWRFLMGAVGNQSTYIRQLQRIMKAHRSDLRLDVIRAGVAESSLPDSLKQLAQQRLDLAAEYIDDNVQIKELVRPGRMIIVDLRDEFIEKDEALGLFVVLMQLFADARQPTGRFNKLVVFDEAHKYIESPDLIDGLVESVREMRHKGMSVLVASQDPPSVPIKLIELSDVVILHKFNSPAWLKHMQKAAVSLADLTPSKMASLGPGEAYVWSSKSTDATFTRSAMRMRLRPRLSRHGGATKTAVE